MADHTDQDKVPASKKAVHAATAAYCSTQPVGTSVLYEDMQVALDAALPHLMATHEIDGVETFESRFYEPDQT